MMKKNNLRRKQLKVSGMILLILTSAVATSWAASGHGEVHNSWLAIDTWKTLNFAVLAIALFLLGRKPVKAFFSSRKKEIADELKDLEQKKAEAEKQLAEYQARFNDLDQESRRIIQDYIQQGEEAKKRIIAQAEAQAEKLEDMAKRTIEQEFKSARIKLQQEISSLAVEQAQDVIQNAISSEDQEKLVDDYLKKVVA
ncbi:F0F1 ATP synthase subunit B [Desulfotignum phosphitoxidans]|uniref:ATP synthase subunit b n=1 Tax=Desulfotignum phosphitoxidans DSM 13687 TaxID=1286635 RepID=S0G721_9BACT|nr:F0F1 ATP synthase subunit B [Desulfotignum phosphitoxidans]EMS80777.1 F-type H+-transporting ATPase subunit b, AtpF [Desulfotignum phosphitoxidans DSM 13687]